MEMKQLYSGNDYKVMEVTLNDGESMPLHKASADAFIIVKKGSGKIIFSDNEVNLQQGSTLLIAANKEHRLQVNEAFNACVILGHDAAIKFL